MITKYFFLNCLLCFLRAFSLLAWYVIKVMTASCIVAFKKNKFRMKSENDFSFNSK